MMRGYDMGFGLPYAMGFGWFGFALMLIIAGLVIAALVKYLRKQTERRLRTLAPCRRRGLRHQARPWSNALRRP